MIVLKSGRHEASSKAAATHTGALMGADDVFDAALERTGAVRALSFGQLFAAAEILGSNKRANGNRLGIVTNGGGAGRAGRRPGRRHAAWSLPTLSPKTLETLDKVLPKFWCHGNPVDILGDAGAEEYGAAVKAVYEDPNVDGLLVMLTPQAMTDADAHRQGGGRRAAEAAHQAGAGLLDGRDLGGRGARSCCRRTASPISPRPEPRGRGLLLPRAAPPQPAAGAGNPRAAGRDRTTPTSTARG